MSKPKNAFVLMPFAEPINANYEAVFKPALLRAGYSVSRADDLYSPKPIIDDIRASIVRADLLLCEMTGRNPNVFYELGMAHAIGKPAILISRKNDDILPFDVLHVRTILYDTLNDRWADELKGLIVRAAQSVEIDGPGWPPPLLAPSPPLRTPPPNIEGLWEFSCAALGGEFVYGGREHGGTAEVHLTLDEYITMVKIRGKRTWKQSSDGGRVELRQHHLWETEKGFLTSSETFEYDYRTTEQGVQQRGHSELTIKFQEGRAFLMEGKFANFLPGPEAYGLVKYTRAQ